MLAISPRRIVEEVILFGAGEVQGCGATVEEVTMFSVDAERFGDDGDEVGVAAGGIEVV